LKAADRVQAKYVLILGEEELKSGTVSVKDLATGEQVTVARNEIVSYLSDLQNSSGVVEHDQM
jgi:histidyl-tRNA synthetase